MLHWHERDQTAQLHSFSAATSGFGKRDFCESDLVSMCADAGIWTEDVVVLKGVSTRVQGNMDDQVDL